MTERGDGLREKRIAEIREREAAATKGPWFSPAQRHPWPNQASDYHYLIAKDGSAVLIRNWKEICSNMEFIASARADIPFLLEQLESVAALAVREATEGLQAQLNDAKVALSYWRETAQKLGVEYHSLKVKMEQAIKLQGLTLQNEIRWMRKAEAAEKALEETRSAIKLILGRKVGTPWTEVPDSEVDSYIEAVHKLRERGEGR